MNEVYNVWRAQNADNCRTGWIQTSCKIKARTGKEAESKMRRKFASAGFHSMALIALPEGDHPNVPCQSNIQ